MQGQPALRAKNVRWTCLSDWSNNSERFILPPATKLGQCNIFRSVCQEFCPQGGSAWQGGVHGRGGMCGGGDMHGRRACMGGMCGGGMHGRGHAWQGDIHGRGCAWWGHVWQGCVWQAGVCGRGDMHGGACMAYGQWVAGTHPTGMHSC